MKDYANFDAGDFARDDDFLRWVKYPDEDSTQFWMNWLNDNPHKREEVEEARRMIMAFIYEDQYFPSYRQKRMLWERVETSIANDEPVKQVKSSYRWYARIAATVLLVMVMSVAVQYIVSEGPSTVPSSTGTIVDRVNKGTAPITVLLEDGSSVVLNPGSALHYPEHFTNGRREVHLEGEAYFEIAKDIQNPFFVYANEVVTKVLGTSFIVRAFKSEPNVTVEVKTGRVSVFRKQDIPKVSEESPTSLEGLVLVPNQQAVYSREESKLIKSLVENPEVLPSTAETMDFEFTDEPMKKVFKTIEEAYGIEIIYDEEVMANCYLNASLGHESLKEKLSLICKAVNASYEVMDTHIIVYGKGCDE